jgi:hypothetical protein
MLPNYSTTTRSRDGSHGPAEIGASAPISASAVSSEARGRTADDPSGTGGVAVGVTSTVGGSSYASDMRRTLWRTGVLYLLLAAGTSATDALGLGGHQLRCGCEDSCWCKPPGLTVLRWVTPGRWHHIGLRPEEQGIEGGLDRDQGLSSFPVATFPRR